MKQFLSIAVLACLVPAVSMAQDAEPGGVLFTFGFEQRVEGSGDRDLATAGAESGFDSITSLSFGVVTETRTDLLSLELGTGLRIAESELTNDDSSVRLAYRRNSADAVFDLSTGLVRSDIAFLRDASDLVDADDFDALTGTGIRFTASLTASLRWGETDPLGYSLRISQRTLRYNDASADLDDTDTTSLGAGVRLNINEVTTANVDLRYTRIDEVGIPEEDSTTLSGALTFDRPLGDLTTRISYTRDEDESTYWAASVERSLDLPQGTLEASLGMAEDETGEAQVTGWVNYRHLLPTGQIDLNAVSSQTPGDDTRTTTLRASYTRNLTPISNMRLGFDYAQAQDSDGSDDLFTGGLSASYGVSLTEYWQLNLGARADVRDDDGTRSNSNTVFLALDRNISWRP